MKKVRKLDIPKQNIQNKIIKVAAYCRVSTKYEGQKSSIELQEKYFTELIEENPNWVNAGVFVDYGSRCRTKGRKAFCDMVHKAMEGEIDYIMTKSISRFSGNTVDMLKTLKELYQKTPLKKFKKKWLAENELFKTRMEVQK